MRSRGHDGHVGRRVAAVDVEPFTIDLDLGDLRERIGRTRWPPPAPGEPWAQGTDLDDLRTLLSEWAERDWEQRQRELNELPHFRAELDGLRIHFVHVRGGGTPLILTHGWPSAFVEMLPLVPLLEGFDLVIPSLPGYGFSDRPPRPHTTRDTAALWHRLMRGLGYERYGAHGTDFGSAVATFMAIQGPLLGLHLSNLDVAPYTDQPLTDAERRYQQDVEKWDAVERGYSAIQSTRPQTVAYGLTDSPAGLAAYIYEKWRAWSDDVARSVLLDVLTIFWATRTIGPSMRDYVDNRWSNAPIGPDERADVPTALAVFDRMRAYEGTPPREWAERLYDLRRYTRMSRGGHFAAAEAPELLAQDIREFFREARAPARP
jgi:pimeloyl-ACP methyl ester carboxylesterase